MALKYFCSAEISAEGKFDFRFLPDGEYVVQVSPVDFAGLAGNLKYFVERSRELPGPKWETKIRLSSQNYDLGEINVRQKRLLFSKLNGKVYDPDANYQPMANAFGYLSVDEEDYRDRDIAYIREFMTDADGRFSVEEIPPGRYLLQFTTSCEGLGYEPASCWVNVSSGQTHEVELFSPRNQQQIALSISFGNNTEEEVFAGLGIDRDLYWKHYNFERNVFPFVEDDTARMLAEPPGVVARFRQAETSSIVSSHLVKSFELDPAKWISGNPACLPLGKHEV